MALFLNDMGKVKKRPNLPTLDTAEEVVTYNKGLLIRRSVLMFIQRVISYFQTELSLTQQYVRLSANEVITVTPTAGSQTTTIAKNVRVVFVDTTTYATTILLPDMTGDGAMDILIVDIGNAGSNNITVDVASSGTIGGSGDYTINVQSGYVRAMVSGGKAYKIIAQVIPPVAINQLLTGFSAGTGVVAVAPTDSILQAIQKLEGSIVDLDGRVTTLEGA